MWKLLAVAVAAWGVAAGAQSPRVKSTTPVSGAGMYRSYCASCHGVDGRGKGPAAPAMKVPPSDLTALAKRSGGKFPQIRVFQIIEGDAALAAHGSREMPVWGLIFRQMGGSDEARVKLRVRNLTKYIESIQK